ncbi:MAG TPA: hypothetical protein IAB84_13455 [Candidatus Choladousia intestinigallinarum]|nr:hypothetical protein [Candidatus Choladousia intestinigallinarum]
MKYLKNAYMLLAFAALFIELFIFNYRTFESFFFPKESSPAAAYSAGSTVQEDASVSFDLSSGAKPYILLDNLDAPAENLYLDLFASEDPDSTLSITISARDQGNNQYYDLPSLTIDPNDESTKYIRLNLSGDAKSLKITVNTTLYSSYRIGTVKLNSFRPLFFSPGRFLGLYAVFLLLFFLRPGSVLYRTAYSLKRRMQTSCIFLLLLSQMLLAAGIGTYNPDYVNPPWDHHKQYHKLAVAITDGHFYLDDEPTLQLKAMENPYDYRQRKAESVPFTWDTAYYEGKYYCYFGILPVFLYYLPWYLLTGTAFPTYLGVLLNAAFLAVGVFFLLDTLVVRYFKKISLGAFVLLDFCLLAGSGFFLIVETPTFYNMPISLGAALTIWGFYFWLNASRESGGLRTGPLTAGAVCMALVAACRPQMLVGSLLALPLFWPSITALFGKDRAQRREILKSLLPAAIPYVLTAAFLMYYNYARFGSPFDFGANYNLTTNDMTARGFHLDRLPFGLFTYLLQPPSINSVYPFMQHVSTSNTYQGVTIRESMFGGFLWFHPILLLLCAFGQAKKILGTLKLKAFVLLSLVMGLAVVCADIEMAGILQRYGTDFGIFLVLPAVLIFMALCQRARKNPALLALCHRGLLAVSIFSGGMYFLWILNRFYD